MNNVFRNVVIYYDAHEALQILVYKSIDTARKVVYIYANFVVDYSYTAICIPMAVYHYGSTIVPLAATKAICIYLVNNFCYICYERIININVLIRIPVLLLHLLCIILGERNPTKRTTYRTKLYQRCTYSRLLI